MRQEAKDEGILGAYRAVVKGNNGGGFSIVWVDILRLRMPQKFEKTEGKSQNMTYLSVLWYLG
jgi:hypothetical protein